MLRFGVELEIANINMSYDDERTIESTTGWDIKCDISIDPSGLEFVSPVFEWENREQVFKMVERIKTGWPKAECNQSCGLHVHMSGEFGYSFDEVRKIGRQWYHSIEDGFKPAKRRRNKYCFLDFVGPRERYDAIRLVTSPLSDDRMHIEIRLFNMHLCKRWIARCLFKAKELGDLLEKQKNEQPSVTSRGISAGMNLRWNYARSNFPF